MVEQCWLPVGRYEAEASNGVSGQAREKFSIKEIIYSE